MTRRISEAARASWLRIVLRVLSVGFLAAFVPWITLILMDAPVLAPGGAFAPLLRLVMLVATPVQKGLGMTLIEGLPLPGVAAVVWWLKPVAQPAPARTPDPAMARGAK